MGVLLHAKTGSLSMQLCMYYAIPTTVSDVLQWLEGHEYKCLDCRQGYHDLERPIVLLFYY